MRPTTALRKALDDPQLLGNTLAGSSWQAWRTLLIACMGEVLTDEERIIFKSLTQRDQEPGQRVEELGVVAGRRGGKSRALSTLACYLASLVDYRDTLAPGERGVCLLIAPDQRQACNRSQLLCCNIRPIAHPETSRCQPHLGYPRTQQWAFNRGQGRITPQIERRNLRFGANGRSRILLQR
jgi:hypothetical protein